MTHELQPREDAGVRMERLRQRAERERRARIAAEELLEQKSLELFLLNQVLEARIQLRTRELEITLANIRHGIIMLDAAGDVVVANERARELLFAPSLQEVGAPLTKLLQAVDWNSTGFGERRNGSRRRRDVRLSSDRWIEIARSDLVDGGEVITLSDVTMLKRRQLELEQATRAAMSASRAKTQFLSTMSHEMRTPLNGVIGALDLLARTSITSEQSSLLQSALSSGEALLYQINNVLDLSRMEAGCIDLEQAPFRPRELVSIVAKIMDPAARSNGNVITTVIADTLPEAVLGDVNRIRQILLNLVSNAIKFTRDGSIEIAIAVDLAVADAPMLVYSVTDTGYGIPANRIPELFEEFAMLDPSYARANAGSGLGLAICKRIATAMGGGMGVESEVGRGSRFWCRLPLNAADAPALAPAPETTSDLRRRLNVLLVDDGPTNRLIGAGLLKSMGHEVVTASSGEEAIALVSKQLFDVVFMDVSMPGMDGLTATRCIRKLEKPASTTPIIALTANALHGDRDRFLAAGMNEHVPKPYRLHDLEDGLRRVLSRDAGKAACAAVPAAAASALPAAPAAVRPGPA